MTRPCLVEGCEAGEEEADTYTFAPLRDVGEGRVWLCESCYTDISVGGVPVPVTTPSDFAELAGDE